MKRRLYFVLPNLESAHQVHRELLLARIEERYMHVLAREEMDLRELPEASIFEKTDLLHGLQLGLVVGGLTGILLAAISHGMNMIMPGWEVISTGAIIIGGALFGAWSSSMVAINVQNTRLKAFMQDVKRGKLLFMVDVPLHRIDEIEQLVHEQHPEAIDGGVEPTIPAFP